MAGCPFKVVAKYSKKKNNWNVNVVNEKHENHELPETLGGYSTARRLTVKGNAIVKEMAEAGATPSSALCPS